MNVIELSPSMMVQHLPHFQLMRDTIVDMIKTNVVHRYLTLVNHDSLLAMEVVCLDNCDSPVSQSDLPEPVRGLSSISVDFSIKKIDACDWQPLAGITIYTNSLEGEYRVDAETESVSLPHTLITNVSPNLNQSFYLSALMSAFNRTGVELPIEVNSLIITLISCVS